MMGLLFVLVGYNDLGTMLVMLALVVGLLWAAGVRLRVFAGLGVLGLAGIALLVAAASRGAGSGRAGEENYRLARLTTFLQPLEKCDADACYQILQARSAISEGGWFGVGSARARSSGTGCRPPAPTSSTPSSPRSWAWWAAPSYWRCSRCWRTPGSGSPGGCPTRSAGSPPCRSPRGWWRRRSSTSAASSACCPSPACRCRSSPTGAPPWS